MGWPLDPSSRAGIRLQGRDRLSCTLYCMVNLVFSRKKHILVLSPHRHSTTAIVSPHTMAFARFPRFIRWLGEKNFIWNNIDAETLFAFSMLCGRLAFHLRGMYNTVFLSRNTPIIEESLK